jgi:hypothetical protein
MVVDFRNEVVGKERQMIPYVAENLRLNHDLEGFTHLTQIMYAGAMCWALRCNVFSGVRRQIESTVLAWQLMIASRRSPGRMSGVPTQAMPICERCGQICGLMFGF